MSRRLIRLKPGFDDTLARAGYGVREFARFAGIPHQTLFALIHPEYQEKTRSLGGMQKKTAWRITQAYARATGMSEEEAYETILVEQELIKQIKPSFTRPKSSSSHV